jgi:rod shape-determining protein MreC
VSAGRVDSVKKNMAVVTADGLVGKVFSVAGKLSNVQLLLDRNYRVSAMIQRSRTLGIIRIAGNNRLELAEIPKRSDIEVGDRVVTSGLSLTYPNGLDIGRVARIDNDEQGMFMKVLVEPAVDFSRLEEVFIIRQTAILTTE